MGRSTQTFEKRQRELDKKQKKEAKRLKKEARKNGEYEPLPEIYIAEEETYPTDETTQEA
jgi:tRNA1(Val) A37 N6-methylase TrmN6